MDILLFVYNWFYTGYTVYGHCLDVSGKYRLLTVNRFRPSCYVQGEEMPRSNKIPSKAVYKRMVTSRDISLLCPFYKVFFDNNSDMQEFAFEVKYSVYMADIQQINVFLSEISADHVCWIRVPSYCVSHPKNICVVKEKDPYPNPKVMVFDIEVHSQSSEMPKPYRIKDTVEMISIVVFKTNDIDSFCHVYILHKCKSKLCIEEVNEIVCSDEVELIMRFFDIMKEKNPTIITGFNIYGFDIKYLVSRLQLRLLEIPDVSRGLKGSIDVINVDWSSEAYGYNKYDRLVIGGRIILDMYLYFKRMKLERYSLDYISKKFIGESKHDMPYKKMMDAFRSQDIDVLASVARYCIQDSILVMKLFEKVQMWIDVCEISKITLCEIENIYTRGEQMKMVSQCVRECIAKNIVLQPQPSKKEWKQYYGAYVLEPKKGVYHCCSLLDFQSLYPSIIIAYNICPSTYISRQCTGPNIIHINNNFFRKSPVGLLPGMIKRLLDKRKHVKELMKSHNVSSSSYTVLDRRQNALKICANSVYGMMGFKHSRYFGHVECADSVTMIGREYLAHVVREIDSSTYPVEVIYGDTDSCMLCCKEDAYSKNDMIELSNLICSEVTNILPKPMALKFESYYDKVVLITKKRYILVNSNKITYKGVMNARRDYCKFAKDMYERIINMVADSINDESIKSYIDEKLTLLVSGEIEMSDMVITKSIAKDLSSYKVRQPHVVMAKRLVQETGINIPAGTRLDYMFVKANTSNQADKMRTPEEVVEYNLQIDGEYYIKKQILTQIDDILKIIGIGSYIKTQWT